MIAYVHCGACGYEMRATATVVGEDRYRVADAVMVEPAHCEDIEPRWCPACGASAERTIEEAILYRAEAA